MSKDKEEEFKSFNPRTGMLDDIDEVRQVGLNLAGFLKDMIADPMFAMFFSPGLRFDLVTMAVTSEALLQPTSHAQYIREMANTWGVPRLYTEAMIHRSGISETLPASHPDAPKANFPPLTPDNPLLKDSKFLQDMVKEQKSSTGKETSPEEKVVLTPAMEEFLRTLQGKSKDPREEGDHGDTKE